MKCFAIAMFAAVTSAAEKYTGFDTYSEAYNYNKGGADWNGLCRTGAEQSPIDIKTKEEEYTRDASLGGSKYANYNSNVASKIANHGMYLKFTAGLLNYTNPQGKSQAFQPLGFKIKSPAEHMVDGKAYAVEVQFINKYANTDASMGANVSVFFDTAAKPSELRHNHGVEEEKEKKSAPQSTAAGSPSPFLTSVLQRQPANNVNNILSEVNFSDFFQSLNFKDFWAYNGSWTNPPCNEGIKWIVLKDVQSISQEQVDRIKAFNRLGAGVFGDSNSRSVQDIGDRRVYSKRSSANAMFAGAASVLAMAYLF